MERKRIGMLAAGLLAAATAARCADGTGAPSLADLKGALAEKGALPLYEQAKEILLARGIPPEEADERAAKLVMDQRLLHGKTDEEVLRMARGGTSGRKIDISGLAAKIDRTPLPEDAGTLDGEERARAMRLVEDLSSEDAGRRDAARRDLQALGARFPRQVLALIPAELPAPEARKAADAARRAVMEEMVKADMERRIHPDARLVGAIEAALREKGLGEPLARQAAPQVMKQMRAQGIPDADIPATIRSSTAKAEVHPPGHPHHGETRDPPRIR